MPTNCTKCQKPIETTVCPGCALDMPKQTKKSAQKYPKEK